MTAPFDQPRQLRPGLWETVNERYPGSMLSKSDFVPLAPAKAGVGVSPDLRQLRGRAAGGTPFDVVHPVGDYSFRRVPSHCKPSDLEIHQIKYPTRGAHRDLNVIFPIERLQELVSEGVVGALTANLFSFIGYNMDPERLERTLSEEIADAVVADGADIALLCPA